MDFNWIFHWIQETQPRRVQRGPRVRVQAWEEDEGDPQDGSMLDQGRRIQRHQLRGFGRSTCNSFQHFEAPVNHCYNRIN